MFIRDEYIEAIERYLFKEMSEAEKLSFERSIQENPALHAQLQAHKAVIAGLRTSHDLEIKKELRAIFEEVEIQKNQATIIRPTWLPSFGRIAAVILMLVLPSIIYLMWNAQTINQDHLFAMNFEPYRPTGNVRTIDAPTLETELEKAFTAYSEGNYQQSAEKFENVLKINPEERLAHFYAAMSRLAQEPSQLEKARNHFEKQLEITEYKEQTEWYLALTYLRLKEHDKATALLQKVAGRNPGFKQKEAQDLLNQLK